ncbi:hypothetical protein [Radiobacillus sp. PE A8.2]|uniref:hypothetical protein n=1 Tax=Radiobacillus sp. PE A8.2 TaxID=3380349 RepID=UPI00388F6020
MSKTFFVVFEDGETLEIDDVIEFGDEQTLEIQQIAAKYTKPNLRGAEKGEDLSYLNDGQKEEIILIKNDLVGDKSFRELLDKKIVVITDHSKDQLLLREGSNDTSHLISMVNRIVQTDTVLKAQYKGYTELTYTTAKVADPSHYKLAISFKKGNRGNRYIKSITVAFRNAPTKQMTSKITLSKKQENGIQDLYKKLLEEQKKQEGQNN